MFLARYFYLNCLSLYNYYESYKLILVIFTTYFLVGDTSLSFIFELSCLIKLLLYLVDLHTSIFLSSLALYIGVTIRIYSSLMLSQCIKQILQPSYFVTLIISYPTHYFTFSIVFYMCVGYKDRRQAL